MTIDKETFEHLVDKATKYDALLITHEQVKHLLSENERVNREKDVQIADLEEALIQQENETLEFVVRNEELIVARDQLRLELQACETATSTPSTPIQIENPSTGTTAPRMGILARLLRFLGL